MKETIMSTSTEFAQALEVSSASKAVKELLHKIDSDGTESAPRGLKVREILLQQLEIDPRFPLMNFEARKFNWKYLAGELAWYLMRDTNPEFINGFSSFWKGLLNPDGTINSNYGAILFGEQLQWAFDSLKKDPNTRQAICFVNQPKYQFSGNKDFVCTMYLNFWIRDEKLYMKVQMRSNDIFYGLSYDSPFFATVLQQMHLWLKPTYPKLSLGTYYHCADNIHYYERHFELAEKVKTQGHEEIFFVLRRPLFELDNGTFQIAPHAQTFIDDLTKLVSTNEHTTENCKRLLERLYFIQ